MFLLNKIRFIPIKMRVLQTWVLSHVFNIMKIMVVHFDKIFPNYGPDEVFRCQIRQYPIPPKLAYGRPFLCLYQSDGGCDTHL
ncbi:hypothetical protein Hanom_Chr05g00459911 [Helianthus anomalus]